MYSKKRQFRKLKLSIVQKKSVNVSIKVIGKHEIKQKKVYN